MYGSQQNQKIDKNKYEKNIKEILLCNFLLGTLQYFKKRHPFFFATKEKKKHPQKLLKNIHFFHPELPKWPKKKDSSSKLWLIEQHLNVLPSNWPKSAFCRTSNLSPKDWIPKKQTTFAFGQVTTISGRFFANYINIFHKI